MYEQYNYHSINKRIAIVPSSWNLSISEPEILELVEKAGFKVLDVDMFAIGRSVMKTAKFKRRTSLSAAPELFNCITYIRWMFSKIGIELVASAFEQSKFGTTVDVKQLRPGDLVFAKGAIPQYEDDINAGIGHIGVISDQNTVLHVSYLKSETGVPFARETTIGEFYISPENFRIAKRILPESGLYTLEIPEDMDIMWSSDVRRKLFQFMKNDET
jgi:hypothetical protein